MSLLAKAFAVGRASALCSLALLLLLAPICSARCQAKSCDAPEPGTQKSACHEDSGGMAAASEHGRMHSQRNCGARELPGALPANPRNGSQDSMALAKSSRKTISSWIDYVAHSPESDRAFLALSTLARSNSPESHSASSASPVLRI
jgi:hypothetical protein